MGQNNSKAQLDTAQSDVNRLLYPIGGGHVGEGPVFTNPIAEASSSKDGNIPQPAQVQPGGGKEIPKSTATEASHATGDSAISNPVFEPESGNSHAEGANGGLGSKPAPTSSATDAEPHVTPETLAPISETPGSVTQPASTGKPNVTLPNKDLDATDAHLAPKTPEGTVPPPAPAIQGSPSSSLPAESRLGRDSAGSKIQPLDAAESQGHTSEHHSSSSNIDNRSSHVISSSSVPETGAAKPLQEKIPAEEPTAPPNTPSHAGLSTSEITPEAGKTKGLQSKGLSGNTAESIQKAPVEDAAPVAATTSQADPGSTPAEDILGSETAATPKTGFASASNAPPEVTTADSHKVATTPLSATAVEPTLATRKTGNTGALVAEEDKVGQGCLCFSPPGKKAKGQKAGSTTATPAAAEPLAETTPADAVGHGGSSTVVAAAIPAATKDEVALDSQNTEARTVASPDHEEHVPSTAVTAGAAGSKAVPEITEEPTSTSTGQTAASLTAVPVPVTAAGSGKTLSQQEATALPPVTDVKASSLAEPQEVQPAPAAAAVPVPIVAGAHTTGPTDAVSPAPDSGTASRQLSTGPSAEGGVSAPEAQIPAAGTPRKASRTVSFEEEPTVMPAAAEPAAAAEPSVAADSSIKGDTHTAPAPAAPQAVKPSDAEDFPGSYKLEDSPVADVDVLSSAEITEMPGIGGSVPETPETEAGSVLIGGTTKAKPLTVAEKQAVPEASTEDTLHDTGESPLTHIQKAHEDVEAEVPPKAGEGHGRDISQEPLATEPTSENVASSSAITDDDAATEATGAALAAGASAGAANAAVAERQLSKKEQLAAAKSSRKQQKKLQREASKKEDQARAAALKDKERQDKERFKQKRKEERQYKKEQGKRVKAEAAQARSGGTKVGVFGIFGMRSKSETAKKEEEAEALADSVGGTSPAMGVSQAGAGAAGAGLSGPAAAFGASGKSFGKLGASADAKAVQTGNTEPDTAALAAGTNESNAADLDREHEPQPTIETAAVTAAPSASPSNLDETPVTEAPEPAQSVVQSAGPDQSVAVVFSTPFAENDEQPTAAAESGIEGPTTPPQAEKSGFLAGLSRKKSKPKLAKTKSKTNVDYSAIQMQRVPSQKLKEGYNPDTRQYDTTRGARVPAGAFSPLKSSQPALQQSGELQKRESLQKKKSMRLSTAEPMPAPQLRVTAPAYRGILTPEASLSKSDYRPMSRTFN